MSAERLYLYRVLDDLGDTRFGWARLPTPRAETARLHLERLSGGVVLRLWSVPAAADRVGVGLLRVLRRPVRREEVGGLLRDLGRMQASGIPLLDALATVHEEASYARQDALAELVHQLRDDVRSGLTVTAAFERQSGAFGETICNLVRIGEESGNLPAMLGEGAEHIDRVLRIQRDIKVALIYPAFVFASIFAVAAFWIYFVVPSLAELFKQLHARLPAATQLLIGIGELARRWGPWLALALVLAFVFTGTLLRRSERALELLHEAMHKLPILRRLMVAGGMAHITEHLALLVRAGIDGARSIDILTRATRDRHYRGRLRRMQAIIQGGESIAGAMRRVGGFPAMAVRMVSVGEQSGQLDRQLTDLAAEYRHRQELLVRSLAELLKPAVILVAGGLFLFLVVALLLPIYDLIRQTVGQSLGG